MTPREVAVRALGEDEAEHVIAKAAKAIEADRVRVDEAAMKVALMGGCCARHVALGRCIGGACGPLTRDDLATLAEVAQDVRRHDFAAEGLGAALLIVCATLAGRMP